MKRERPLLIYDGDCGFCMWWVERWRTVTGDRVEYRSSQEVAGEFPDVRPGTFEGSVQFIDVDGRRYDRAAAVFRSLAVGSRAARLAGWAHAQVPGFAFVTDAAYDGVARNRMFLSRLGRWLR